MKTYFSPSMVMVSLQHFVLNQAASGETPTPLTPLECSGNIGLCDVSPLGSSCSCNSLNMSFLVPGANCLDINGGADCSLTPVCSNPQFSSTQCSEGCVVEVTCSATCDNVEFTASCPGFETCASNPGADNC